MAAYDFRTYRLHVKDDLALGRAVIPDKKQINYLTNVLRLQTGSKLLIFNGRDGEWLARLVINGKRNLLIEPLEQTRSQPEPLTLLYGFSPLKQARQDYMIQKAVEIGAGELVPIVMDFTQIRKINLDRANANIIEAAQQCGILSIPRIHAPLRLENFLSRWSEGRSLIYCDEHAANENAIDRLQALKGQPLGVLIGPEGGFSEPEQRLLHQQPNIVPISLGPRILRADTAAVAALSLVQAHCGDMFKA